MALIASTAAIAALSASALTTAMTGAMTGASEDPDIFTRVFLAFVLASSGGLVAASGWLGAEERLRRNRSVGIRTRRSLASDEAWRTVHRFAAPWYYASGATLGVGGLAAALVRSSSAAVALVLTATSLSFALSLLATWRGHRALDRVERQRGS